MAEVLTEVTAVAAGDDGSLRHDLRYDDMAIALHWATALLVLTLFGLAHIWSLFPHDGPVQIAMQTTHVSLGVILAVVIVARLLWKAGFGRRLPQAGAGAVEVAARGMHVVLYGLLIAMAGSGLMRRWVRKHGVEVFAWRIPSPMMLDPAWRPVINGIHHWGAWIIVVLAGLHAAAALFHHYVVGDGLMSRMTPGRRRIGAH